MVVDARAKKKSYEGEKVRYEYQRDECTYTRKSRRTKWSQEYWPHPWNASYKDPAPVADGSKAKAKCARPHLDSATHWPPLSASTGKWIIKEPKAAKEASADGKSKGEAWILSRRSSTPPKNSATDHIEASEQKFPDSAEVTQDSRVQTGPRCDIASEGSTAEPEDCSTSESDFCWDRTYTTHQEKEDPIEHELNEMVRRIEPDNSRHNLCQSAMTEVRRLCNEFFNSTAYISKMREEDRSYDGVLKVTPYGSYRQRTNIVESDLDLVVVLQCGVSSRDVYWRHLSYLKKMLEDVSHFDVVSLIPAKIPVLKLVYRSNGSTLPIDITIAKPCEHHFYRRDSYVNDVTSTFKRLTAFIRIVKHWSKENRVNNAADGSLNSTSWVFLILTYLRHLGLLQADQYLFKDLLIGFFSFISSLDNTAHLPMCVDVTMGRVSYVFEPTAACLVILDPSTGHNCAQALTPQSWQYILALCRSTCAAIYNQHTQDDLSDQEIVRRRLFGPFLNLPPFPAPSHDGCMVDESGESSHALRFNHGALHTATRKDSDDAPSTRAATESDSESGSSDVGALSVQEISLAV